jgi:hypothetical protein
LLFFLKLAIQNEDMRLIVLTALISFFLLSKTPAQHNHFSGARAAGMGNAFIATTDLWSVYHNQAGLTGIKELQAGMALENRFLVKELSVKSLALATPIESTGGTFGFSVSHFGFSLYSETKAGIAYAQRLSEKVSAGIQMNYFNTYIGEGNGNRGNVTAEAGVQAEITEGLTLGAHISNPFRAKLANYNNERISTIMRLGLNYIVSDKVIITAEVFKDSNFNPRIRSGIEYHVIEQFYLRAGIGTNPSLNAFGFGLNLKNLKIDFATSMHSALGYTPSFSMNYSF